MTTFQVFFLCFQFLISARPAHRRPSAHPPIPRPSPPIPPTSAHPRPSTNSSGKRRKSIIWRNCRESHSEICSSHFARVHPSFKSCSRSGPASCFMAVRTLMTKTNSLHLLVLYPVPALPTPASTVSCSHGESSGNGSSRSFQYPPAFWIH